MFVYNAMIDAETAEIKEESYYYYDVLKEWEKQYGESIFWSIETNALFDKMYMDFIPASYTCIEWSDNLITPEEAAGILHAYLQQHEQVDVSDYYTSTKLILTETETGQQETQYWINLFSNEYVNLTEKTLQIDCPYYYAEINAQTGQLIWICYAADSLHVRDVYKE